MKTNLLVASLLIGFITLFASLPRKTCYQGNVQGYHVQVDTVTRFGKTTSLVVVRPASESLPTIMGAYTGSECEFLTLTSPHRFAAEPAQSRDPIIKQAWSLLETGRVAVATDEHIVRPVRTPLWVKLVPLKWIL